MDRMGKWCFTQCGVQIRQREDFGFELDQERYMNDFEGISLDPKRENQQGQVTEWERTQLRALIGGLQWRAQQSGPDVAAAVNMLASTITTATVATLREANLVLKRAKSRAKNKLIIHPHQEREPLVVATWTDAAHANRPDGGSTGGLFVGIAPARLMQGAECNVSAIYWRSHKLRRVCKSSGAAEAQALGNGEDENAFVRASWLEITTGEDILGNIDEQIKKVPGVMITDSKNCFDSQRSESSCLGQSEKRVGLELLAYKLQTEACGTETRWVHGDAQLANSLTKPGEMRQWDLFVASNCRWKIVHDDKFESARKRKLQGKDVFQDDSQPKDPV